MKVCVVGGTGNISASIVRRLLETGHEVTCFNRGRTGRLPEGVRLIAGDRKERDSFEKTMQGEKFDAAIDMICFGPDDALSDVRAFRGVKHFIQVSTVCTYGVDYDWLPVSEDHPLRPTTEYGRSKCAADDVFRDAHAKQGFPVTIVKPSTTFGPKMGLLRQVAWEFSWISRVLEGRPILISGDGQAVHQFLHVDDAALGFAGILGKEKCIGETYNLVAQGFTTWRRYHESAMRVLGKTVELVGVCCSDLAALGVPSWTICRDIFMHNCYYGSEKIYRDVPEFRPRLSLEEGMRRVYAAMRDQDRVPESPVGGWEDKAIARIKALRQN